MKIIFKYILFLISISSFSQNKWEEIDRELWDKLDKNEISTEQWYMRTLKEAGSIGGTFSAWFEKIESIDNIDDKKIRLCFAKNFQIEKKNGNRYALMYLENYSNDTILIPRSDSTIDNFQEFFLIDNKWVPGRKRGQSMCGNGSFKQKIEPKNRVIIEVENHSLTFGQNKVKYKVTFNLDGQIIESNIIEVKLFDSQLERLKSSI